MTSPGESDVMGSGNGGAVFVAGDDLGVEVDVVLGGGHLGVPWLGLAFCELRFARLASL